MASEPNNLIKKMSDAPHMSAAERRALLSHKTSDQIAAFGSNGGNPSGGGGVLAEAHASTRELLAARSSAVGKEASQSRSGDSKTPTVGKTYRIKLCSDHWGSKPGCYLDAHRSDKKGKDKLSNDATHVLVHDSAEKPTDDLAGLFLLEGLDSAALAELPANFRGGSNCFRIKLTTGHYGCPAGLYLCGIDRKGSAKLDKAGAKSIYRTDDSSWAFVQPLGFCGDTASSVWTIEPVDGQYATDGRWQIRLLTERTHGKSLAPLGSRSYLEVHCSDKKDKRSEFSAFVNLHVGADGCVGEWSFHEVFDGTTYGTTINPLASSGRLLLRSTISDNANASNVNIVPLPKGSIPSIGKTFRIRLNTSHFQAQAGMYLDAHRSISRDQLNEESSFVLVHSADSESPDGNAGHWHLESLTDEELWTLPADFSNGNNCFRIKLQTCHFGCPRSLYLSGATAEDTRIMDDSEGKPLRRNKDSTWAFVQPLWCCGGLTSNIWTLEPADEVEGAFKLRLVTERNVVYDKFSGRSISMDAIEAVMAAEEEEYENVFLEVHRSSSKDARNADSNYAIIHSEFGGCVGEWSFEEVHDPYAERINRREEEYTNNSYVGRQLLRKSIGSPGLAAEESQESIGARKIPVPVQILARRQSVFKSDAEADEGRVNDGSAEALETRKAVRRRMSLDAKRARYLAKKAAIVETRELKQETMIKCRMEVEARRSVDMMKNAAASAGHLWDNVKNPYYGPANVAVNSRASHRLSSD
jgi:hypothetical protein